MAGKGWLEVCPLPLSVPAAVPGVVPADARRESVGDLLVLLAAQARLHLTFAGESEAGERGHLTAGRDLKIFQVSSGHIISH